MSCFLLQSNGWWITWVETMSRRKKGPQAKARTRKFIKRWNAEKEKRAKSYSGKLDHLPIGERMRHAKFWGWPLPSVYKFPKDKRAPEPKRRENAPWQFLAFVLFFLWLLFTLD